LITASRCPSLSTQNCPREHIDLFLAGRRHLTIYQPLGWAKPVRSQSGHDGTGKQVVFISTGLFLITARRAADLLACVRSLVGVNARPDHAFLRSVR